MYILCSYICLPVIDIEQFASVANIVNGQLFCVPRSLLNWEANGISLNSYQASMQEEQIRFMASIDIIVALFFNIQFQLLSSILCTQFYCMPSRKSILVSLRKCEIESRRGLSITPRKQGYICERMLFHVPALNIHLIFIFISLEFMQLFDQCFLSLINVCSTVPLYICSRITCLFGYLLQGIKTVALPTFLRV